MGLRYPDSSSRSGSARNAPTDSIFSPPDIYADAGRALSVRHKCRVAKSDESIPEGRRSDNRGTIIPYSALANAPFKRHKYRVAPTDESIPERRRGDRGEVNHGVGDSQVETITYSSHVEYVKSVENVKNVFATRTRERLEKR